MMHPGETTLGKTIVAPDIIRRAVFSFYEVQFEFFSFLEIIVLEKLKGNVRFTVVWCVCQGHPYSLSGEASHDYAQ